MTQEAIESWHVLFPNEATSKILNNYNFIERFGCKFIWKNRNFKNFDDFLEIFTARQRKTIKAEKKHTIKQVEKNSKTSNNCEKLQNKCIKLRRKSSKFMTWVPIISSHLVNWKR